MTTYLAAPAAPEPDPRRKAKAEEIKRAYREGITGVVRAGVMLRGIKEEMLAGAGQEKVEGYREFRQFHEGDLGWPKSQVNRLIDIAGTFGDHTKLVVHFDLSAMYALSRAPQATVEAALERANAGEFITHKLAKELLGLSNGRKGGKKAKQYKIDLEQGAVVVSAPHRTLAQVREALEAAMAVIDTRIAKRRRTPPTPESLA